MRNSIYPAVMAISLLIWAPLVQASEQTSRLDDAAPDQNTINAISVARSDFQRYIAKRSVGQGGLDHFVSDMENYRVATSVHDEMYEISFIPKEYRGVRIRGGVARYEIEAGSWRIVKFRVSR